MVFCIHYNNQKQPDIQASQQGHPTSIPERKTLTRRLVDSRRECRIFFSWKRERGGGEGGGGEWGAPPSKEKF